MGSFEKRAAARRVLWSGAVARSPEEAAAFERAADRKIPPSERVGMIWELVLRMDWGEHAREYRLDRSLGRVERRRR